MSARCARLRGAGCMASTSKRAGRSAVAEEPAEAVAPAANSFPLHAMKMSDFLALEKLEPHNTLVAKGLVVPLDFDGAHADAQLNFVSHQWLAYAEADPECAHLRTMQDVFTRAARGDTIFGSEEEWNAYSKGLTAANLKSATTVHGAAVDKHLVRSEKEFFSSVVNGWVWMDYFSIPQTITCTPLDPQGRDLAQVLADQKAAINSIPAYVQHAWNFWVCAPSGALHADTGLECNYETWAGRGWCRMEESTLNLVRMGEGRPLLVTHALGSAPRAKTIDRIDRMWMYNQRFTSVLTGAFSCCRLKHEIVGSDGSVTRIACDREALKRVLTSLLEAKLAEMRALLDKEGGRALHHEERLGFSQDALGAYRKLWAFSMFRPTILAEACDEQDYVAEGWSKPFEQLTRQDYETFCTEGDGMLGNGKGGFDMGSPASDVDAVAYIACVMGHLPMLRYCVETLGANPGHAGAKGVNLLMLCCRFGQSKCLRYLCERLVGASTPEPINYQSKGLGLTPICDAAKCGHPDCIATLLEFGAHVDPQRKNGKTPLHEAAEKGFVECVKLLVRAGADMTTVEQNGKTPRALAAESLPVREDVLAVLLRAEGN